MRAFFTGASGSAADSDALLRRRVEQLPCVIFETDAQGSLVFLGGAALAILGRPPADCLHKPLPGLVAEESRPALTALLRRESAGSRKLRVRIPRPDGTDGQALLSLAPADTGGMVGTLQGVGAEADAEHELAQLKEKVAATAAAKKVYIANISHQVRTPLAAIIGLSQLCLNTRTTDKQRDYLSKTEQAAQDLYRVVNDILDFSGIDAGGVNLESGPFQVRNLLAQVDAQMRPLARAKGLELQIERGETLPAALIGDPSRLQQILVNVIGNAIKFTAQGSVCVSATVKAQEGTRVTLEFRVSDTGIGLQPHQIGQIFEAHTHADGATTRPFGGMGLGLAIAKRLVEKMGGSIWVTSTPGIGSTFYFSAQYACAEAPSAALAPQDAALTPAGARPRLRNVRILVVEDNRFNQQIAMEFLEAAGAQVTIAENGARALQCLDSEPRFDAVLMDVQMPVMDGHEATRRIRSNPALSELPVIALTANTTAAARLACSNAGMNDFESKPIDPERLYATIARWLPNRQVDSGRHVMPAVAATASAAIDRSALARLVNFDPVKIRRFALKFVENSRATLVEMQSTSKQSDLIALGRLAHRLKSSAATVGAEAFSTLCKDLEQACQKNDATLTTQIVRELAPALEAVNSELLADDGT
jgi:two-component system, sensor histidine kinase and response regulator